MRTNPTNRNGFPRRRSRLPLVLAGLVALALMITAIYVVASALQDDIQPVDRLSSVPAASDPDTTREATTPKTTFPPVDIPDWIEQKFIRVNPYSRPGTEVEAVNGVVIHNTGNPNVPGINHYLYFDRLADQTDPEDGEYKSSNFVVGLEGEILMLMPIHEMAYASNTRNIDTLSIEVCQTDNDGTFTQATYDALVRLTAWLCAEFDLDRDQILMHADVYEWKDCPRYFYNNPDKWREFKDDVMNGASG